MINKDKLKRRFSRQAKTYDKYAIVQKYMGDYLLDLINTEKPKRILEIGSGTGYVTTQLANIYPDADITALDIAEGMIKVAKNNLGTHNINFICGDIEEIQLDQKYDLIISNATFQWFNKPLETLTKINNLLELDACLCFSTFGQRTFYELHECYHYLRDEKTVSPGQSFFSKDNLNNLLFETFSKESINHEKEYVEYFDSCLSFFDSIKKIGANNSSDTARVKDPYFLQNVIKHYEQNYKVQDKIKATYHALFYKIKLDQTL